MRTDPARCAALLHGATRSGGKRGHHNQLAAMLGWTGPPFLGPLRQSTLLIASDDDPIIPVANPKMRAALIPHSQLHPHHGDHLGILTEAAELAPIIDAVRDDHSLDRTNLDEENPE